MRDKPVCGLCGEPMPEGEEMFKNHGYSGPCPKPAVERPKEDIFQEYLERAEKAGVVDFAVRIVRSPEGLLDFYIHPHGRDGETGDFTVAGGFVTQIRDRKGTRLGAGSSRSAIELLGS